MKAGDIINHDHSKVMKRVSVLYYLCRLNGQLEQPHFMEVPLSSPKGLFLTDVINRLNVLRGKGMPSMYSWSCKRRYKNGFVWQDLSENDFICPAHANDEYVLKGSELPANAPKTGGDDQPRRPNHSCTSIDFDSATANNRSGPLGEIAEQANCKGDEIEIEISPPPSDSSPETLETLMKADRQLTLRPPDTRKGGPIERCSSSVLMQLISCGSIPFVKGCGSGYMMRAPRGGGAPPEIRRVKAEDQEKEYYLISGSLVETKQKEEFSALKGSSSNYNADR